MSKKLHPLGMEFYPHFWILHLWPLNALLYRYLPPAQQFQIQNEERLPWISPAHTIEREHMKVIHEPLSSSFNLPSYFSCSFQKNNLVDRMPQCGWFLVLSMTLLTNQSFWFSLTSMIRDGHKPLRVFSSARSTTSPMRKLRGGLNQFSLSFRCGSYSFMHPCQNTSDRYWTWCNLHQEYCLQYYYDST